MVGGGCLEGVDRWERVPHDQAGVPSHDQCWGMGVWCWLQGGLTEVSCLFEALGRMVVAVGRSVDGLGAGSGL